ncbi:MAG: hypothetical protein Q7S53_00635 [bacterium]|nr:hypothetical protein [bacterium]
MGPVFWLLVFAGIFIGTGKLIKGRTDKASFMLGTVLTRIGAVFGLGFGLGFTILLLGILGGGVERGDDEVQVVPTLTSEIPLEAKGADQPVLIIIPIDCGSRAQDECTSYYYSIKDGGEEYSDNISHEEVIINPVAEGEKPTLTVEYGKRRPLNFFSFGIEILPRKSEGWEEEVTYERLTFNVPESKLHDLSKADKRVFSQ